METGFVMSAASPLVDQSLRVVLHVGCGPFRPDKLDDAFRGSDWRELRLDIDATVEPDIVASITNMAVVPSESVDAVWSSHNIEHLYAHEVLPALREFHRVLKQGGIAKMRLPDLQRVAEFVAADRLDETIYQSPAGPITPLDILYGHRGSIARGNRFMAHHTGYTAKTLGDKLLQAGFEHARVARRQLDLWAVARKGAAIS